MLNVNLKNITLQETNTVLLQNLSFTINPNQVLTILGKNGSGKTTMLNSLTGLLDPQIYRINGSITFNGQDILLLPQDKVNELRSRNIKYVFQDALNCFDPLYKLKYYFEQLSTSEKLLTGLLNELNLPELDKIKNYYPYELSGGMAQRLAIVIAAASNPDIILFDEPTSNLDYGSANILKHFIKRFAAQDSRGIIVVSQDIDFALSISDVIIYIDEQGQHDFIKPSIELKTTLKQLFN